MSLPLSLRWSRWLALALAGGSLGCGSKPETAKRQPAPQTEITPVSTPATQPPLPDPENPPPTPDPVPTPLPTPLPTKLEPPERVALVELEQAPMPRLPGEVLAQAVPAPQPPAPGGADPKPPEKVTPPPLKKVEYPKKIDNKDLAWWLLEAQKNVDPQLRQNALNVIPNFGPDARKPSLNTLVSIVSNETDPGVRMAAITLLSIMGYEDKAEEQKAISAIRGVLASSQPGTLIRAYCLKSITAFGPLAASPNTIVIIRNCMTDPSWETRLTAITAMGSIGMPMPDDPRDKKGNPDPKKTEPKKSTGTGSASDPVQYDPKSPNIDAIKAIIELGLNDNCAAVRLEATQCLLRCGPPVPKDPKEYARALELFLKPLNRKTNEKDDMGRVNNLREKSPNVLVWLHLVQIMYNSETLKDNLTKMAAFIRNPEPVVQVNALNALALLGQKASPVVKDVTDALMYDDPSLVAAAINCLASMGKDGGSALPELEKIKNGSKDPKKPADAPKDWKPDETLRQLATDAIEYVTGRRKIGDPAPAKVEEKKEEPKKEEPKKP